MHLPVPAQNDDAPAAQTGDSKAALVELLQGSLAEADAAGGPGRDPRQVEKDGTEPTRDPEEAQKAAERAGEAEVPGYEGPFATAEERAALGRDIDLLGRLTSSALKKRVPESDLPDVVQETLASACRARRLPGGSGEDRNKYVFGILRFKIADYWSDHAKQQELNEKAEAYFGAAAQAVDAVADRDLLEKLVTVVQPHQHSDLRCLLRHKIGGVPMTTLALERGEDYEAFAKRMKRLWRKLQIAVGTMGGVFALLLAFLQPRPDHPLAFDAPGPVALSEPAVSTHAAEAGPKEWANVLRGEAFRACMQNKWQECLDGLDAARELDPAGERDPIVAAARSDATNGTGRTEKPNFGWKPPVVRAYAQRAAR